MGTQIIRTGSNIRLIVNPRSITHTLIVDGYLIVNYSDGTSENAGFVGSSPGAPATIYNTTGDSDLPGSSVDGFTAIADTIDMRLTALGY